MLSAYSDSDFASDKSDRKSRSGFLAQVCNSSVIWWSRKQKSNALNTCESEYFAMNEASKDVMWLRNLIHELGCKEDSATVLSCDNIAAKEWASKTTLSKRAKHIDVRYFYVREQVESGNIVPTYVPSNANKADGFTKPPTRVPFENFHHSIGVQVQPLERQGGV